MTRPRANLPEWADSFRKIVELEAKHGFDDSAVIGGLDRFRHRWQTEMEAKARDTADSAALLRGSYGEMSPKQRETWAAQWLRLIGVESAGPFVSPTSGCCTP